MIIQADLNRKVFACTITINNCDHPGPLKAHVLFLDGKAILLSDAVDEDGNVEISITWPYMIIDTTSCNVQVDSDASHLGRVFDDVTALLQSLGHEHLATTDPTTGKITLFQKVPPPKGTPRHVGYIETSSGRKEVQAYPRSDTLRIIDCSNPTTSIEIPASDLPAYFKIY